jgi:hypothetical protein
MKFRRLPVLKRIAQVHQLRGERIRVVSQGETYEGRVLAVGVALHGTSYDWLAIDDQPVDRFISLATIETIERIPDES